MSARGEEAGESSGTGTQEPEPAAAAEAPAKRRPGRPRKPVKVGPKCIYLSDVG